MRCQSQNAILVTWVLIVDVKIWEAPCFKESSCKGLSEPFKTIPTLQIKIPFLEVVSHKSPNTHLAARSCKLGKHGSVNRLLKVS